MRKAGRPRNLVPTVELSVMIDKPLHTAFEELCYDPLRGKPQHGLKSAIINKLLYQHLESLGVKVERMPA